MRPRTAFAAGWLSLRALNKIAVEVAKSDTGIGAEIRQKILGRMSFEHLMRLETEVGEEINRRVRGDEKPKRTPKNQVKTKT